MAIVWKHDSTKNAHTIVAKCDAAGWSDLSHQLAEVLIVLAEKISTLPPDSWNRIYIEHWPDSGRLILYPHKRGDLRSERVLTVVVTSDFLLREYEALPGPDSGVPLWDTYHMAMWGKRNQALGRAAANPHVVAAMRLLAEKTDFTAWNQESDDPEIVSPIYFIQKVGRK